MFDSYYKDIQGFPSIFARLNKNYSKSFYALNPHAKFT